MLILLPCGGHIIHAHDDDRQKPDAQYKIDVEKLPEKLANECANQICTNESERNVSMASTNLAHAMGIGQSQARITNKKKCIKLRDTQQMNATKKCTKCLIWAFMLITHAYE